MDESNENSMTLFPEKFSSYVFSRGCVFRTLGYGNTFDPQKMYSGRDYKENFAGYFGYEVKQLYIEFPKQLLTEIKTEHEKGQREHKDKQYLFKRACSCYAVLQQ